MNKEQLWLSKKYLVYRFFSNLWFLSAIWLYFYRLFITDQQVGVLDGMAFAIGLIAEVPSGALADKFGRDRMVRLGQFMTGFGIILQSFGSSFMPFFIGQSIMMIGVAFVSGADDALFFDKLKFDRESSQWRKLVTRSQQVRLAATLSATIAGGLMYSLSPRLPWFLTGLSFIISVAIVWPVREDGHKLDGQDVLEKTTGYLSDIKTGFMEFLKPNLWIYVPLIITVQGLFYTVGYGILRLALIDRFGFTPFQGSIVIASSGLITIGVLGLVHRHSSKISEKTVLSTIAMSAALGLMASVPGIGYVGFLVILAFYVGEYVLHPFMSETINYHSPPRHRATVLSVASFLSSLPYVLLAPVIGYMNTQGKLEYFLVVWAVLIVLSVFVYLSKVKSEAKLRIQE